MILLLLQTVSHAAMITGFVFMMMVIIEYLNVLSRGVWQRGLRGSRWRQYLLASFLGATPGCLGAFVVVSLYLHREVSLGALVVAMVATSGDESFVMLSMIPDQALLVFTLLVCIGLAAGYCTDLFFSGKGGSQAACPIDFDTHEEAICHCFPWGSLRAQWRQSFLIRGTLGGVLLLFLLAVCAGWLGPAAWNWLRVTLVMLACLIGLIPESGPHLLFLTLFVENVIPFSTFLASSIVQDGHGMLPLLAESRRDFLKVKAINLLVGFLVGFIGYASGW